MANTDFNFFGGSLILAGTAFDTIGDLCIQSATVSIETDNEQYFCLGSRWAQSLTGGCKWSVTCEASYDAVRGADIANTVYAGADCAMTLETGTGGMGFTGNVKVSSVSVELGTTKNTMSLNLIGNGALTEA
jgi:hypothetical protein